MKPELLVWPHAAWSSVLAPGAPGSSAHLRLSHELWVAGNSGECFHSPVCTQDKQAQRAVFIAPVPLQLTATIYIRGPRSSFS